MIQVIYSSSVAISKCIAMSQFILFVIVSDLAQAGSKICVGSTHSCFIDKSKSLYCWGSNSSGQIGISNTTIEIGDNPDEMRYLLPISTDADEVTCGTDHTCFISSGSVYCFGSNTNGQLGLGSSSTYTLFDPITCKLEIASVTQVTSIEDVTCASTNDSVYCWGNSIYLSYGYYPVRVILSLPSAPLQLSVGRSHACYLLNNGTAYCWGDNLDGQLGIGTTAFSTSVPTRVEISSPISSISAGYEHTCVSISGPNTIVCFGNNDYYQLGDKSSFSRGRNQNEMNALLNNTLLGSGNAIAGNKVTCLISSADSGVYCIGYNFYPTMCNRGSGFVSYGSKNADYPPNFRIPLPLTSSITLALGVGGHQCATDGIDVYCWGSNFYGELGNEGQSIYQCATSSSFKKACFGSTCPPPPTPPPKISIIMFIPLIVVCSVLMLTYSILIYVGSIKRQRFNERVFLHPNGNPILGFEILKSYTQPLGQPGTSSPTTQSVSVNAIISPNSVDPLKPGYDVKV